ncbi:hypothetical protein [Deinococcus sp. PESE-13]
MSGTSTASSAPPLALGCCWSPLAAPGLGKLAAPGLGAALLTTSAAAHCPAYSALGTDTLDH